MSAEQLWNMPNWHLIQTHPKQETRAESNLKTLNIQTYVPMYRAKLRNRFTGETTRMIKPLFPRYIFARFKVDDLYHKVSFTRGVRNLVCFNHRPTTVDGQIIDLIRAREDKDGFIKIEEETLPGDEVVINKGPFKDFLAIFERTLSGADRVVLLLQTVSFQVHLIVDHESIRKATYSDSR